MAQPGSDANPAGENTAVPEPPSPEQLMAQMAAMVEKMAAMQVEIDMQKLQMRGIGKMRDEDSLEYTPPATAVRLLFEPATASGAAAADDAGPAVPAIPASFFLTPQRGQAAAAATSWTQQGWVDYGVGVAPPLQHPPGFVDPLADPLLDPWNKSAQIVEKHADEAAWAARGWIDRSKTTQMREPWCAPAQWRGDWQQCTPAQWQPDSGPRDIWGTPFQDLHKKDIERPEKYSGDIAGWLKWQQSFARFLRRQDWRWLGVLEKVQELRGKPVTPEHERQWEWEM